LVDSSSSQENAEVIAARAAAVVEIVGAEAAQRLMRTPGQVEPVYELRLGDASVFWFEPLDGFQVVAQRGLGSLPLDGYAAPEELTASQLFAKLAPRDAVPAELRALDQRTLEMRPVYQKLQAAKGRYPTLHVAPIAPTDTDGALPSDASPAEVGSPGGENLGKVSSALTSARCVARQPCNVAADWSVVQLDVTATRTASHSDANFATGLACSINGTITYSGRYRTWFSWTNWWSLDIGTGTITGAFSRLANLDYDIETTLSNFQRGEVGAQCANGF
jgi:hypothetical protein